MPNLLTSSAMPSNIPANLQVFIANNLTDIDGSHPEVPDACPICHEDIDANHRAVQITGISNCTHVFGRDCLMSWLSCGRSNQNTCPMCRASLYRGQPQPRALDLTEEHRFRAFRARFTRYRQAGDNEDLIIRDPVRRRDGVLFNRITDEPRSLARLEQDIQESLALEARLENALRRTRENLGRNREELSRRLENGETLEQAQPMRAGPDNSQSADVATPTLRPEQMLFPSFHPTPPSTSEEQFEQLDARLASLTERLRRLPYQYSHTGAQQVAHFRPEPGELQQHHVDDDAMPDWE